MGEAGGAPQIAYGGNVVVFAAADGLHAIDLHTGHPLWRHAGVGNPVVGGGVVYGGRPSQQTPGLLKQSLIALDLATGAVLWERPDVATSWLPTTTASSRQATGALRSTTPPAGDAGSCRPTETIDG